jgi:aspartyl/asparaginyl-tRNA synthetase
MRASAVTMIGLVVLFGLLGGGVSAQTTEPTVLKPDDPRLHERLGQTVLIEGVVSSAEWSQTGKVMEIRFVGVSDAKGFTAVVFDRNRKVLDEAFDGDLAKSLSGATVRLKGKLRTYGGRAKALEGRIEMTLDKPEQITITAPSGNPPPAK